MVRINGVGTELATADPKAASMSNRGISVVETKYKALIKTVTRCVTLAAEMMESVEILLIL